MPSLNIKVGASIDRNMGVAYRPLVDAAKKARQAIEAESKQQSRTIEKNAKDAAKAEAKAFADASREIEKWRKADSKAAEQSKKAEVRAFENAEKEKTKIAAREQKDRERGEKQAAAAAARETKRSSDAMARDTEKRLKASKKDQDKKNEGAFDMTSKAARGALGITKAGAGAAIALAKSYGVDTDIGSILKKNANLETAATNLSNSGYMAGDARNGKRVDPRELMNEALDAGAATGTDAGTVMEGLSKFVGLSGDLATGREVMGDLLKLSKATGTEFDDMAAAAANVANVLPDSANKGKEVYAVMQAIAGQGKLGAVEIADLASQMAGLAAKAGNFSGNKAEQIGVLGMLAQEARQKGGSKSASQAVTSVSSFVETFDKGAREKAFNKFGVKTRDDKGFLRDSRDIIKDSLVAASKNGMKDFSSNMGQMFASTRARSVTQGFENIYKEAGGGDAGLKAVADEMDRLKNATLAQAEIEESFARSLKTGQSQAEMFNATMQKTALQVQDALLPALIALAPMVVDATKKFADVTSALFGPDKTEKALKDNEDKANSVLDSAVTQVKGGKISSVTEAEMAEQEKKLKDNAWLARSDLKDAKKGRMSDTEKDLAKGFDYTPLGALLAYVGGGSIGNGVGSAMVDKEDVGLQKKEFEAKNAERLYQEMVNANKTLHDKIDKGLVVRVSNIDELKGGQTPGVDGDGRQPPPGAQKAGPKQ